MTKYYVDGSGNYMGGFDGDHGVDVSAWTEVPNAPEDAAETWDGTQYDQTEYLKKYLDDVRKEKERGGVIFNSLPVATDDRSKVLINGAYNKAKQENDPTRQRKFKGESGFITVDNATIIALGEYVADHIQKCFDAAAETDAKITAGTLTTKAAVEADFLAEYDLL